MGANRLCVCFGYVLDVCWTFTITWQVEMRAWSSREVGSHPFRSRDGHLGHGCDGTLLTDGQRSGMKTGKRVVQENPRQEGV